MQEFLLALPVLIVSVVAHEYAHGYAALLFGDATAAAAGRLTFNPLKHVDPWMTILLPAILWFGSGGSFVFGGAKPVPINPANYRGDFKRADTIVSAAGIAANLVLFVSFLGLSVALGIIGGALPQAGGVLAVLQRMFFWGVWLNALLAFFNLIPIPPLDGSHILYHFLPPNLARGYRQLSRYGFLLLLALLVFLQDLFSVLLLPAYLLTEAAFGLAEPFSLQAPPF